ncbi:quinolinate synthetase complex, A subunit [Spirochaeta thermophila DSM 6578]|uniref:Quinolinate synthase n=1 Tax=Winmispira thermophila (strain ATCC 700085 / DSM 6578 / Z-1203) TaxID=869211 RepID=G0GFK6_WINT7|nr:quinolinate synthase NadA [Spirochaeta thermophila]AEJ62405.1 quinolinate synthetase complex, A subunit [Spirochaeta thermophila DSM 6578]
MTLRELKEDMKRRMGEIVPEVEIPLKAELILEIRALKEEKNALILGHNYMEPALYTYVPDERGDSLELSRKAAGTDKPIIVFCGVKFMAETAKILNPSKKVLIPSLEAGCSLAESITAEDVRAIRALLPGVPIVTYVNTYADVKAESDYCCTSGNADRVVKALGGGTVVFLPDQYLASNVAEQLGRRILFLKKEDGGLSPTLYDREGKEAADVRDRSSWEGAVIGWGGRCEVHEKYTVDDVRRIRAQFPDVCVLAHPECPPEVVHEADFAGSTRAMIDYVESTEASRYLLLTECSMGDNIMAAHPEKKMLRLCSVRCPHMNQITLEQTRDALRYEQYEVFVDEQMRERALTAVERMLAL